MNTIIISEEMQIDSEFVIDISSFKILADYLNDIYGDKIVEINEDSYVIISFFEPASDLLRSMNNKFFIIDQDTNLLKRDDLPENYSIINFQDVVGTISKLKSQKDKEKADKKFEEIFESRKINDKILGNSKMEVFDE